MARAGHPLPALVHPGGDVEFPDLPAGPPLGLGGIPFETRELELAEGSQIVFYTDGLIEDRTRDIDVGIELLREALGPDRVADWDVPFHPGAVGGIRSAAVRKLAEWGLDDLSFAAELILSELITNAIRYGAAPVRVRLLHDRGLTCEVADNNSTSPHLRYAATTDEGGRGLFLVAQLAERWGTRYTAQGKVIWAELPLPGAGATGDGTGTLPFDVFNAGLV
jgi:anti-sigma regulatory factor (Ser/Thr protein kinase)